MNCTGPGAQCPQLNALESFSAANMAGPSPLPLPCSADDKPSFLKSLSSKAAVYHGRVPYISKLPFPAVAIIIVIAVVNVLVWAAVGIVLVRQLHWKSR